MVNIYCYGRQIEKKPEWSLRQALSFPDLWLEERSLLIARHDRCKGFINTKQKPPPAMV